MILKFSTYLKFFWLELIGINVDSEAATIINDVWLYVNSLLENGFGPSGVQVSPERIVSPISVDSVKVVGKL